MLKGLLFSEAYSTFVPFIRSSVAERLTVVAVRKALPGRALKVNPAFPSSN